MRRPGRRPGAPLELDRRQGAPRRRGRAPRRRATGDGLHRRLERGRARVPGFSGTDARVRVPPAGRARRDRPGALAGGSVRSGPVRLARPKPAPVAQPASVGSGVQRHRDRLRARLHPARDPREAGGPVPPRSRLRVSGPRRHDREIQPVPGARSGLEAGAGVLRPFAFARPAGGVRCREARPRAHRRRRPGRGPHRRDSGGALGRGRDSSPRPSSSSTSGSARGRPRSAGSRR